MKTTNRIINHLLGAVLSLLVTFGFTHRAAAQTTARIVFDTPTTTSGSPKHPTITPGQIYSMNPDGTDVVRLTDYSSGAGSPSWSPDQQYVSYNGGGGLSVMEAIGEANGGRVFLVATDVQNTGSDWSPDGTALCFCGYSTQGLWIVNVNPATGEVGTPIQVAAGWCGYPSWSPDGTKIAYTFGPPGLPWGNQYVKVLDLTTGAETSFGIVSSAHPEWSPDGTSIAFDAVVTSTTTKGNKTMTNHYFEVFIANADGTAATQVTNFKGTALPSWSPDGGSLALTRDINGVRSIYRMDLSSGDTTFLHDGEGADW